MTRLRSLTLCAVTAAGAALLVATTMAALDWRLNPGGVFQTPVGTRWDIVWQTWISWFLPVALSILLICIPFALWAMTRRPVDHQNEETG